MISSRFVFILLCVFALCLAGCASRAPEPAEALEAITVSITPAARPATAAVLACAQTLSNPVRILERYPDQAVGGLLIRLGVPPGAPGFLAQLAEEEVAVVLNPAQDDTSLDVTDLQELFSGRVDNWSEMGAADQSVRVWAYYEVDETLQAVETELLSGLALSSGAMLAPDPGALQSAVAEDPAAIGMIPLAWDNGDLALILTGIQLPVLVQSGTEPAGPEADLVACLQGVIGQAALADAYP